MPDAGGRGLLLVFEGGEGVGKTTQVARLVARLGRAGVAVERHREPGGTRLGEAIRALLLDDPEHPVVPGAEALLFMAARAELMTRVSAQLARGTLVVLDRFFLSTYAYQIAGRGLPEEAVRAANRLAVGNVVPSLTILLTADPAVATVRMLARGAPDRLEREAPEFHARVAAAFVDAARPEWQRAHPEVGPVVTIAADGGVDDVERAILAVLAARWPETFAPLGESQ